MGIFSEPDLKDASNYMFNFRSAGNRYFLEELYLFKIENSSKLGID
jgi:hypothetical protein